MFEKFAEDVNRRYQEKLAALVDMMEKDAAKWARTNAKRFGKNYTMGNFVKDYNAAYTNVNPGRVNPFAAKLNNNNNLTAEQRAQIQKLHDNWNLTNINPNGVPVKNNLTFAASTLNRPAQSMFNYIDNTMTPGVAKQMREGRNNAKNFADVVREAGGKNPVIKGLSTNEQGRVGSAAGSGIRYDTMNGNTDNSVSNVIQSREKNPNIRQTEREFIANNPSGVTPDSEHVSMFSGRADVAGNYTTVDRDPNTFNGNFAIGNLNNIYPELASRGIRFTPKLDSFNLPYRIGYPRMLENATGMKMTPYIKSLYSGEVPQTLSRKYEIAIPENLIGKLNAQNVHVFNKEGKPLYGTFRGMNQPAQYANDESYFNLKNFIKRAPGMENIQAIPLEQYLNVTNGLQNNFRSWQSGRSQSANKILETLGKFGVDPSLLTPYK